VHTALEVVLLEVAQSAASAQHLSLHDILHLALLSKLLGNEESLFAALCDTAKRNGNAIMMKQLTCLILMKLDSTKGKVLVDYESAIDDFLPHA
jgi:hypothetical protein